MFLASTQLPSPAKMMYLVLIAFTLSLPARTSQGQSPLCGWEPALSQTLITKADLPLSRTFPAVEMTIWFYHPVLWCDVLHY